MRPTAEQLAKWKAECIQAARDIKDTDSTDFNADPAEVLSLIDEVERLREKCDDLTVNGFQAKLKQLDEAEKEVERLQAEVKRLKEVVAGYFGAGQRIQDLSDDCGLLEESNKTLRAEVARLHALLRDACADPESQPSLEAWATIRCEFGKPKDQTLSAAASPAPGSDSDPSNDGKPSAGGLRRDPGEASVTSPEADDGAEGGVS